MCRSAELAGRRILIVEDEYFVAAELQALIERHGGFCVGPVATLDAGISLFSKERLDGALLDINLMGAMSYELADRLEQERVPFIFLTGYDIWSIPERYYRVPRIGKPFSSSDVADTLSRSLERGVGPVDASAN